MTTRICETINFRNSPLKMVLALPGRGGCANCFEESSNTFSLTWYFFSFSVGWSVKRRGLTPHFMQK